MTPPEAAVWSMLRAGRLNGWKFARQVPIGPYIVDFAARREKLVIEIDGQSHSITWQHDARRDVWLRGHGYTVVRFTNNDLLADRDTIARTIEHALRSNPPGHHAQTH